MFGDILVVGGRGRDIFCAVANWVAPVSKTGKALPGRKLRAVIVDIARDEQDDFDAGTYEGLLNGTFLNGKYLPRPVLMDPIHVIVFSNAPPNRARLSEDRWAVFWIGGEPGAIEPKGMFAKASPY